MSFIQRLLGTGAAYLQHNAFINRLAAADAGSRGPLLTEYLKTLSEAGAAGLKLTAMLHESSETDVKRKDALQFIIKNGEVAGSGSGATQHPADARAGASTVNSVQEDMNLLNSWFGHIDRDEMKKRLVDHLITLDARGYASFQSSIKQLTEWQVRNIADHKENEKFAMGRYMEDQINYRMLKLRNPGWQDPTYLKGLRNLEAGLENIQWTEKFAAQVWPMIQERRAGGGQSPRGAHREDGARLRD